MRTSRGLAARQLGLPIKGLSLLLALLVWLGEGSTGSAGLYKTKAQALQEAFPGGYERKTAFLTANQQREVERRARSRLESKLVTYYIGRDLEGKPAGTAFLDTHRVRAATETVFVWIHPDGRVRRVEILALYEPEDYKMRPGWLERLEGKRAGDELQVGRGLVRVTGATLSAQALAAAVRRSLSLHAVLVDGK